MCPDCTAFDNHRAEVLRRGFVELPQSEQVIHWSVLLDEAGLSMSVGDKQWLHYAGGALELFNILTQLKTKTPIPYTPMDDHDHIERAKPFPHTLTMPRAFRVFCPNCIEVVLSNKKPFVIRMTKGVYLPIEHECNSVRVYSLQGTLLEVKAQ